MDSSQVLAEMERIYQRMLQLGATGNEKVYIYPELKKAMELGDTVCLAGKELPVMTATGNEWPGEQTPDDIIIR